MVCETLLQIRSHAADGVERARCALIDADLQALHHPAAETAEYPAGRVDVHHARKRVFQGGGLFRQPSPYRLEFCLQSVPQPLDDVAAELGKSGRQVNAEP